jgi:hypothetical protein
MAIINDNGGMYMPVAPAYGGGGGFGGFGDNGWWIILLLLCGWGGMGGYGMGGFGGGLGIDFPWILNGQNGINANTNSGFDHAATQAALGDLRTAMGAGFGDVQLGLAGIGRQICETGNGITGAVRDGFYTAEIAANGRQIANMQQSFGFQQSVQQGFRDVIENNNRTGQLVLDKLCQLELDGYKREADNLRVQLSDAKTAASQAAQNAFIQKGFSDEVDALYNRLSNCPVPSTPVYGRTPIFTCNNGGCGCGVA